MKLLAVIALLLPLLMISCSKSKTANTMSSKFTTLAEKQEFLERYVTFHVTMKEAG